MVDGVTDAARIKLHHVLHGYAEGHRELASSIQLKPRDAKTMLVLSDVSGPGVRIDESGYLTGYPLPDAGLYAFARTWAAPEKPRPGCVWTHTLLIDFADLARLAALTDLVSAFRRPQPSGHAEYAKPLHLDCAAEPPSFPALDELRARRIIGALYSKPKARIIAFREAGSDVDSLVTAIWSQQWPRLRRNFRFCTLAATDRSTDGAAFDLQLLPSGNQAVRTRFPKTVEADAVALSGEWLEEAIDDLMQPRASGLRGFLRQIGGDVSGGRAAFATLCRLHRLIDRFGSEPGAVFDAIALLQNELGATQARAARATVAGAAIAEAEALDDSGLDYLLAHMDLVEPARLAAEGLKLGRAVLRRRPDVFASLIGKDDLLGALALRTVAGAASADLTAALATASALAAPILSERPELAAEPALWARELGIDEEAFSALRNSPVNRSEIIVAILAAGRTDLAYHAVAEVGPLEVLRALALSVRSSRLPLGFDRWLHAAAQPGAVAELFARPEPLPRRMLAMLARCVGPDDTPNDYGEDPWLTAVRWAEGETFDLEETHLRAFLLARSLGWRTRNQAELAQLGFEPVHHAAAQGTLPDGSWRWLDQRLPWPIFWFEWDRCQRLRAGVAALFVEHDLSPVIFGTLVEDGGLFGAVAEQVARSSEGRSYLKRVRRALRESSRPSAAARRTLIEKLTK